MTEYTTAYNDKGEAVQVEVGADGETPVSPNNPPPKAAVLDRLNPEVAEEDESVGIDGDNVVSPNNPPANTQTVSEDVYRGAAPEGVDPAIAEAAVAEQYPASYQPVKDDVSEEEKGHEADDSDDDESDEAPAKAALKADWVDYAVKQGADRDEAEDSTKEDLIEKYGN